MAPPGFTGARAIPPESLPDILARSEDDEGSSVVLDDPADPHRLRIEPGAETVGWAFILPYDDRLGLRLHAIRRLVLKLAGRPTGVPPPRPTLTAYRRYRLALALRTLDGEAEGASRREIGTVLFAHEARDITAHDWKGSGLRKKIARLVRLGRTMRDGGYRHLLSRTFDHIRWG